MGIKTNGILKFKLEVEYYFYHFFEWILKYVLKEELYGKEN